MTLDRRPEGDYHSKIAGRGLWAYAGEHTPTDRYGMRILLVLVVPACAVVVSLVLTRIRTRAERDRSLAELERVRATRRAERNFIARFARELRRSLTSIHGLAGIVADDDVENHEATEKTLRLIVDETAEMSRKVDDLMVVAALAAGSVQADTTPTRIGEVIEAVLSPYDTAGVVVNRQPTPAMVDTDPTYLRHVLVNLVSNAVQHGGTEIAVEVNVGDDTVDIEVMDNGPGVPEGSVARIMESAAGDALDRAVSDGRGLGLPVAFGLTDLLDGSLRFQRYGGRSYFVVTLPAELEPEDDERSVAEMIKALSA